jgi:hypothetical protein
MSPFILMSNERNRDERLERRRNLLIVIVSFCHILKYTFIIQSMIVCIFLLVDFFYYFCLSRTNSVRYYIILLFSLYCKLCKFRSFVVFKSSHFKEFSSLILFHFSMIFILLLYCHAIIIVIYLVEQKKTT